jgi:hypothetical protein
MWPPQSSTFFYFSAFRNNNMAYMQEFSNTSGLIAMTNETPELGM